MRKCLNNKHLSTAEKDLKKDKSLCGTVVSTWFAWHVKDERWGRLRWFFTVQTKDERK